jgi:hypothetical protein
MTRCRIRRCCAEGCQRLTLFEFCALHLGSVSEMHTAEMARGKLAQAIARRAPIVYQIPAPDNTEAGDE